MPTTRKTPIRFVRREKVKEYLIKGFSYRKIAEILDCDYMTVKRDTDLIREEVIKEIRNKPFEKVLANFLLKYDDIFMDAYELYKTTSSEKIKAQMFRELSKALTERVKVLQSLGLVHEAPMHLKQEFTIKWIKRVEEAKEVTVKS